MENKILVPTDFSKVAECAVDHAVKLASELNGKVVLLHVIAKDSDRNDAKLRLEGKSKTIFDKYKVEVSYVIETGNIFDDIGKVANEIKAKLIIMGTHGAKGMQKLTGSHALKVITNSEVPFVVVQERPIEKHGYKKIVFPIDISRETKHKLKYTIDMANYFHSEIILATPQATDEFYVRNLKNNLAYVEATLKSEGLKYRVVEAFKGDFTKQIVKIAVQAHADLIAIVNEQKTTFLSQAEEQEIIENDPEIPVLCVNKTQITKAGGVIGS